MRNHILYEGRGKKKRGGEADRCLVGITVDPVPPIPVLRPLRIASTTAYRRTSVWYRMLTADPLRDAGPPCP
ncbi:MAG: hypothetical protein ACK56F_04800 [bacterium]